jgi:type IV secretion system protein VirB10
MNPEAPDERPSLPDTPEEIPGDRGASTLSSGRSLQSRVGNLLAFGLIGSLSVGLLGWYYVRTLAHPTVQRRLAQATSQSQAEGDLPLPAIGKIDQPSGVIAAMVGPKPQDPESSVIAPIPLSEVPVNTSTPAPPTPKTASQLALERRLGGPVSAGRSAPSAAQAPPSAGLDLPGVASSPVVASDTPLALRLHPSATPTVSARVLPTQRLLLPKGAFIDCTLETALNSSLPGMATCITATDTFGADGQVVLLERGTKLVGETTGTVAQGVSRLFVLWTEARTPTGVVIPLASPGTDELGRAGVAGLVNRHFFERFGAAVLITMIDGAVQRAASPQGGGGTVVLNPSGSQDVMTEVLKETVNIAPTIDKPQGDRIQVLVARDLDFRSVYELRSNSRP